MIMNRPESGQATTTPEAATSQRPASLPWLSLGILLVVVMWGFIEIPTLLWPTAFASFLCKFYGPMVAGALFTVWWLCGRSLRLGTRFLVLAFAIVTAIIARLVVHPSMHFGLLLFSLPLLLTAWLLAVIVSSRAKPATQLLTVLGAITAVWIHASLIRVDGLDGSMVATKRWRWSLRPEDEFLAARKSEATDAETSPAATLEPVVLGTGDWPGFRGPGRDSIAAGASFDGDWKSHPPKLVWKQRIGPGWSSFAVAGNLLFTQEQRGDREEVVCYDAETGREIWTHDELARFEEVVAGAGPRATPTLHQGKLYALGATGKLVCLDAATGKEIWSRDVQADSQAKTPQWGFSSSPLVVGENVIVHAGGPDDKGVLAYSTQTGDKVWSAGHQSHGYCSPQLFTLHDTPQVLINSSWGTESFDPQTGRKLWAYEWEVDPNLARIVQPALIDGDKIIVGTGMGVGTKALRVLKQGEEWKTEDVWTTLDFKPYFNDFVVSGHYAYGFDGNIFCCINLEDGKRQWKKGRYGSGQVLLLPQMNKMLVLSEKGELVLLEINPEKHQELAKIDGIEGKTWNHPVIAHGKLFVRNAEESACFALEQIAAADGQTTVK